MQNWNNKAQMMGSSWNPNAAPQQYAQQYAQVQGGQMMAQPQGGNAFATANGTMVSNYPTVAAAAAAGVVSGCPLSTTDSTTMVPKTIITQHKQLRVWYTQEVIQQPVTTATSMRVVSHPSVCDEAPQVACAQAVSASPCGTGACGVGAAGVAAFTSSTVLPGGTVSQTPFRSF